MTKQKILIVGSKGMLGNDMIQALNGTGFLTCMDIDTLDITAKNQVDAVFTRVKPDIVVNCSAYTNVDACEEPAGKAIAFAVNADGVENLAKACKQNNALLVHISTDYVFNGEKKDAYTEDDQTAPINVYGQSKYSGEQLLRAVCDRHLILRTSWLFGRNGKNFVSTMLNLSKEKKELRVVSDQVGCPTYTVDLAGAVRTLISSGFIGTFHVTNSGYCSWHAFTVEILSVAGVPGVNVVPVTTAEFPRPAPRPKNSILSSEKLNQAGILMPSYQSAIRRYIAESH